MKSYFIWLFLIKVLLVTSRSSKLLRDRTVLCNGNEMRVVLDFESHFSGVVFAERFYTNENCKWIGDGSKRIQFSLPLNANSAKSPYCGVRVKEAAGEFTIHLTVSPMKTLLIEGVESLLIRCSYAISDVTLTLPIGSQGPGLMVNAISKNDIVTGSGGSPFLQMVIRDGHGIQGNIIQSAQVGQKITLDVVMRDTSIYDFYVHDCLTHDGKIAPDSSIKIIDSNGCVVPLLKAVEMPAFMTFPVPHGAKHVYAHMYGFQFTTTQLVYFECQVRPCLQTCNRAQCVTSASNMVDDFVDFNTTSKSNITLDNTIFWSLRQKRSSKTFLGQNASNASSTTGRLIAVDADEDNYNLSTMLKIVRPEDLALPLLNNDFKDKDVKSNDKQICFDLTACISILFILMIVCGASFFVATLSCFRGRLFDESNNSGNLAASRSTFSPHTCSPYSVSNIIDSIPSSFKRQTEPFRSELLR